MTNLNSLAVRVEAAGDLHEKLAKSDPKLTRGQVWCRHCGFTWRVSSAFCLKRGWPKCCGYTMTIDPPEEWPTPTDPPALEAEANNDMGASFGPGSRPSDQAASRLAAERFDPSRKRLMEWSVQYGQVLLSYPDGLTADDVDDLEQLFALTVRMMRRRLSERDSEDCDGR